MSSPSDPADQLWKEYTRLFERFDDYSLARWLVQTLGHFSGGLWRYSHPLIGAYKLAAQVANQRQLWLKRLVDIPAPYSMAECCRAPLLPLATRDVTESGLICLHCNETTAVIDELPEEDEANLKRWSDEYETFHRVAHFNECERAAAGNYEVAVEEAASKVGLMLIKASESIFPRLLEVFPAVVWEDHDECLGVRPEDLMTLD